MFNYLNIDWINSNKLDSNKFNILIRKSNSVKSKNLSKNLTQFNFGNDI